MTQNPKPISARPLIAEILQNSIQEKTPIQRREGGDGEKKKKREGATRERSNVQPRHNTQNAQMGTSF